MTTQAPGQKIPDLPGTNYLAEDNVIPIDVSGTTKKTPISLLRDYIRSFIFSDLGSNVSGKGGSLVGLEGGGTVQTAHGDVIYASGALTVETAHSIALMTGKKRVVVARSWNLSVDFTALLPVEFQRGYTVSCGSYALNLSAGFVADDYQQVFLPGDASKITLPFWQRLTPQHFGAKANYNGVASQGTDDGDALNAWASKLCWRVMPRGKYGTTKTVYWNGDNLLDGAVPEVVPQFYGIRAEVDAEIIQRTDNIPVLTFYGTRGEWRFPRLSFMNDQATTNYSAICALCAPRPGQSGGFATNAVPYLYTVGGACGVFFPRRISSTINAPATAGAISITVADAQTDFEGAFPWRVGMYVQIEMNSAYAGSTMFITRIMEVSSTVLTLRDPLPVDTSVGKRVAVAVNRLANGSDALVTCVRYSNTWSLVYIERPTRYGWVDTGNGTQDLILNRYVKDPRVSYYNQIVTLQSAIVETFRNGDRHCLTNIEQFIFAGSAWKIAADSVTLGSIHFEGCRLTMGTTGLLNGTVQSLKADLIQVVYCTMVSDDLGGNTTGIFLPSPSPSTVLSGQRGIWTIDVLDTGKNIVTPANGFVVRNGTPNDATVIKIGAWRRSLDSGFRTNNISYAQNIANIVDIGGLVPPNTVAYLFGADMTTTSSQGFRQTSDRYKINKISYGNPSVSMTTATAGVWNESGATNLVSASGTTALSPLTGPNTIVEPGLHSNETNKLRLGSNQERPSFRVGTTQAAPSAVAASSRYLTGRQGGANNTNLAFINFGSTHGFTAGQRVTIADSSIAALNGVYTIVDVPSTTRLVVYQDSVAAVGTAAAPITTGSITVQLMPTIDVFCFGDRYSF